MEQLVRDATSVLAEELDRLTVAYQTALARAAKKYETGVVKAHHQYDKAMHDALHAKKESKPEPKRKRR